MAEELASKTPGSKFSRWTRNQLGSFTKQRIRSSNKDPRKPGTDGHTQGTAGPANGPSHTNLPPAVSSQLPASILQPATTDPIDKLSKASHKDSSQVALVEGRISELWNDAYNDLRVKEKSLVNDYEATLSGSLTTMIGSSVVLSGKRIERQNQMQTILKSKVAEVEKEMWELKFGSVDVPVKDLQKPVVATIEWVKSYIDTAVGTNPYASIAWAGVSLLLPVSTFPFNITNFYSW